MSNARTILIVDDDAELRDTLVEQLALHEEFEAKSEDSAAKGIQTANGSDPRGGRGVALGLGVAPAGGRTVG